jgi:hypothetical protein
MQTIVLPDVPYLVALFLYITTYLLLMNNLKPWLMESGKSTWIVANVLMTCIFMFVLTIATKVFDDRQAAAQSITKQLNNPTKP